MLQLLQSPLKFPVEAAMGSAFFCISAWDTKHSSWKSYVSEFNVDILWFFVPLIVLTFWLHKVNRWAYMASGLLFLPLMALNLKPFLWTYGFGFTYLLAAILLIVGVSRMDNRSFASHALHVVTQLFFGLLIAAILNGVVFAIVISFFYIFDIDPPAHIYEYVFEFIWFFIAPQVCCTLISQDEYTVKEPAKVLSLILNFILSPAIIIYTVILYAYFIKIIITWNLPQGGVAWMVMGFVAVSLVGRLMQYILSPHYYDWFYRYFTWIAIPPLIVYWVGTCYRISHYSLTESRFYLMVAGILMTLFVLMLLWRCTRKFRLMALIFGAAIAFFTYIPGISAKNIGLVCQKARLQHYINELKLTDANTKRFVQDLDINDIKCDSILCDQYREACSIIDYVRHDMGYEEFETVYGKWDWTDYDFSYNYQYTNTVTSELYYRSDPVNLGEYNIMLSPNDYSLDFKDDLVSVQRGDKVVLVYPINDVLKQNPQLINNPDSLLMWRNDSLMLVLSGVLITTTTHGESMAGLYPDRSFDLFKKTK